MRGLARERWGEFAFVENPYPDEVVFGPDFGKLEVVQEFNKFGKRVRMKQWDYVQFPTGVIIPRSHSPWKYKTVPTGEREQVSNEKRKKI